MNSSSMHGQGGPPAHTRELFQAGDHVGPQRLLCVSLASLPTSVPVKQEVSLSLQRLDLLAHLSFCLCCWAWSEYFVLGTMAVLVDPPATVLLHRPMTRVSPNFSLCSSLLATCFLTSALALPGLLSSICLPFVLAVPLEPSWRTRRVLWFHVLRH